MKKMINDPAPGFPWSTGKGGETVSLASLKGKTVVPWITRATWLVLV